jgi:hypothetical protein
MVRNGVANGEKGRDYRNEITPRVKHSWFF